jgi:hypothetical protein
MEGLLRRVGWGGRRIRIRPYTDIERHSWGCALTGGTAGRVGARKEGSDVVRLVCQRLHTGHPPPQSAGYSCARNAVLRSDCCPRRSFWGVRVASKESTSPRRGAHVDRTAPQRTRGRVSEQPGQTVHHNVIAGHGHASGARAACLHKFLSDAFARGPTRHLSRPVRGQLECSGLCTGAFE